MSQHCPPPETLRRGCVHPWEAVRALAQRGAHCTWFLHLGEPSPAWEQADRRQARSLGRAGWTCQEHERSESGTLRPLGTILRHVLHGPPEGLQKDGVPSTYGSDHSSMHLDWFSSLPCLTSPALTCSLASPPRLGPHTHIFISGSALGGAQTKLRWSERPPISCSCPLSLLSPHRGV